MTSLSACAIVDQYSGRAIVYNLQAEQAQNQAILLNIVRASMRRPMQFTTVSSITGTASATGGTSYSLPVNVPFRPPVNGTSIAQFPALPTWNFSGSMSGGPTFTVPVLDTQEFYNGILKPIPAQLWNLYTNEGYAPSLLFNLFVEKIVIRQSNCPVSDHYSCTVTLQNYVGDDIEIELFQLFSDYLLRLGLTTEQESSDPLLRPDKRCALEFPEPQIKQGMTKTEWENIWRDYAKNMAECVDTRIPNAVNVNVKLSGSIGGASSSAGGSGGGTGGAASAGGDTAPSKFLLCFAPTRMEEACVYPQSRCGAPRKSRQTGLYAEKLKEMAEKCDPPRKEGSGHSHQETSAEAKPASSLDESGASNLKETIQGEVSEAKITAGIVVTTEIVNYMQDRLIVWAPQIANYMQKQPTSKTPQCPVLEPAEGLPRLYCILDKFKRQWVKIEIHPRSTEGVIYYLGEIARRQLNPKFSKTRYIYFNYPRHYLKYDLGRCIGPEWPGLESDGRPICRPIFILEKGTTSIEPGTFLSTLYEGEIYSVPNGGYPILLRCLTS